VYDEVARSKQAAGHAHVKTILEVGELGTYDKVRRASLVAMAAGSDVIKTSTGKIAPASTHPFALVMAEAIRDFADVTGRVVGLKVAGGVRNSKEAVRYLVIVHETLGEEWLTPDRFRIGASSLLNDLLMQIDKQRTGFYSDPDRYTLD
jgi:deoxyribose-phosphate aldolase